MLPTLVIVGRPNVGKSTLFNRLTKTRAALVADFPGLTRDRHYGRGRLGDRAFLVVDTGGFEPVAKDGIRHEMAKQTRQAIAEADVVIFLVDGRAGLTPEDQTIAHLLRRSGRPVVLAANKAEGLSAERAAAEFYELGLGEPHPISSAHGDNVTALIDIALGDVPGALGVAAPDETLSGALGVAAPDETLPRALGVGAPDQTLPGALLGTAPEETTPGDHLGTAPDETTPTAPLPEGGMPTKVAIVGRPNVGKSTLVNTLLGEERVIAFNEPGTTRDSIYLDFERSGRRYTLIDTAGVRRRGKVADVIEKFSVIKTLQAIEDAHVVVLLLDAQHEVTEQDAHLAGYILDAGRALVVGINKWDGLAADRRDDVKREFGRKLAFLAFAHHHYLSAKDGRGVGELMRSVDAAYAAAMARLPTPKLTRALQQAVERQQPPRAGMGRPKLRYAHQGGQNPPLIIIHGSALAHIPDSYRRYLEHFFTDAFQLRGTPLRIQFKTGANPYANLPARRTGRKGRRPGFPVG